MNFIIAILCVAAIPGYFCDEDIHRYMSPDEVRRVFHTDADSVPEYEVVRLQVSERLHKRDLPEGSHFRLRAFGEDINLWLHPRDSLLAGVDTPVYYAKSSENATEGVEYRHRAGLMRMVGRIFEDPSKLASLVIGTEDNGRTRVNGHIQATGMAIRSLPQRVVDEYNRRRRSVDDSEDPRYSPYHVVIKMNENMAGISAKTPVNETVLHKRLARTVTAVPDTLYPEILVVIEYSVYSTFNTQWGHDVYGLLEYILAFWNGVDLKYRSLDTPRFRFHISAIVLAEDDQATPYIGKNMVSADAFDSNPGMQEAKSFYYGVKDTFDLDSYDVAATMTRLQFGIDSPILGQAWTGSACQRNDNSKTIDAVTIFLDDGIFGGVHFIAHELGHVFGSWHDPSSDNCTYTNGFIMAPVPWITTNSSDFSPCSMKDFQKYLDAREIKCLFNRPQDHGQSLPKLMPGRMKNLETQCRITAGGDSCQEEHPEESICVNMFCIDENGTCVGTKTAALDGTPCGNGTEFCLHQQCVSL